MNHSDSKRVREQMNKMDAKMALMKKQRMQGLGIFFVVIGVGCFLHFLFGSFPVSIGTPCCILGGIFVRDGYKEDGNDDS